MKKATLLTISILFLVSAQAQSFKLSNAYAQFGTASLDLKTVFKKKWAITVSTAKFDYYPQLPDDFQAIPVKPDLDYPLTLPPKKVRFSSIAFGLFHSFNPSLSITADAGIGIATTEQFGFTKTTGPTTMRGDYADYYVNYAVSPANFSHVGGIVRVGFDWAFSSFAGLGVDGYYNYNSGGIGSNSRVNIKILVGWMNTPKKNGGKW